MSTSESQVTEVSPFGSRLPDPRVIVLGLAQRFGVLCVTTFWSFVREFSPCCAPEQSGVFRASSRPADNQDILDFSARVLAANVKLFCRVQVSSTKSAPELLDPKNS